jgi:hypothetical protein
MSPFHNPLIFPVALALALISGVLLLSRRNLSRIRNSLGELARRTGATLSRRSLFRGDLIEGRTGGVPFSCLYLPGSKNRPPSLTVRVHTPCPLELVIRRKSWYDRFAVRIGLTAELATGDPLFDQAYSLATGADDAVRFLLADEKTRRRIEALFGLGFPVRELAFGSKGISLALSPFRKRAPASVPLERCLEEMGSLAGGFPHGGSAPYPAPPFFSASRRPPVPKAGLALLFIFQGGLSLGGAGALIYGLENFRPIGNRLIQDSLLLSAGTTAVFLAVIFLWLRRRPAAHRLFPLALILSLTGFPLALSGGAVATNGLWDQGAEVSRPVPVTALYHRTHKNGRTYYAVFPFWQRPGLQDRVHVPFGLFRKLHRGDEIVLRVRPGYWQEEWIAGLGCVDKGERREIPAPALPLRLLGIRFYEGGAADVPLKDRLFAGVFSRSETRFIHCQIDVGNGLWGERDCSYTFVWRYLNPDDSLRGEVALPFTIRKGWETAWVSHSWGWARPGNWPAGTYRVAVAVDGRPWAEGTFRITE